MSVVDVSLRITVPWREWCCSGLHVHNSVRAELFQQFILSFVSSNSWTLCSHWFSALSKMVSCFHLNFWSLALTSLVRLSTWVHADTAYLNTQDTVHGFTEHLSLPSCSIEFTYSAGTSHPCNARSCHSGQNKPECMCKIKQKGASV